MYAVIFRSIRTTHSEVLYQEHSKKMDELVKSISGYISHHSHRDSKTKEGITVSYFQSLEAINKWREHPEHKRTQELGRTTFYSWYEIDLVKVERKYDWTLEDSE